MKTCKCCNTELRDTAQYCHNCGLQVEGNALVCLKCSTPNPGNAKFCFNCGFPINVQYTPKAHISPRFKLDFNDIATLPAQLKDAFLLYVSYLSELEGNAENQAHLAETTFETSGFRRDIFDEVVIKLVAQLEKFYQIDNAAAFPKIEKQIDLSFLDLGELFWIKYMPSLQRFPLSKSILNYQGSIKASINLQQMIQDYLQLSEETLVYYLHAVDIPIKKLSNARKSFFNHDSGEFPIVLIDQTLFGSSKEGLVFSQKALYWKAAFHKSMRVPFEKINNLKYYTNYLEINGAYCNLTETLNYKIYKLLNRLKVIY